ncbi:hypothetical protein QWA68_012128 [Fusarium oxysporum]|nr:hypothetical protein QWA68_012128 [Fusarium oxysporum]
MKDRTFHEPAPPISPLHPWNQNLENGLKYVNYVITPGDGSFAVSHRPDVAPGISIPKALTDPIFQDIPHDARELIDYYGQSICSSIMMVDGLQNPYRDVISLVGASKAVANAIMAVASCHAIHSKAGYPVFLNPAGRSFDISTMSEINRSIIFKQKALAYLADAISEPLEEAKTYILATITLLMLLELYEGGAGPWRVHLEGAKQLLDAETADDSIHSPRMIRNMLEELAIVDIFGSAFVQYSSQTLPLSTRLTASDRDMMFSLSGLGCPMQILTAIESVNLQWRAWAEYGISDAPTLCRSPSQLLSTTLVDIVKFDAEEWTDQTFDACPNQCSLPRRYVLQLSMIWKLSAEIYTSHVSSQVMGHENSRPQVLQLIAAINSFDSVTKVTRFLLWPVFIVGAESTCFENREWALTLLDKIWQITYFANAKTAAIVLKDMWKKKDMELQGSQSRHLASQSWINALATILQLDSHYLSDKMGSVKFSPDTDIPSLAGKIILITGGNSGLGLETARQLLKHEPSRIFLACRSKAKFDQAVNELRQQGSNTDAVSFPALDLASLSSIKSAAKEFQSSSTRLDILVNNAGIMMTPEGLTEEGYEIQIGTNHMGHAFLTHLLLPTLEETTKTNPDVRIVFVSSMGESISPKNPYQFDQFKTTMSSFSTQSRYGISKLANVHYAAALAERYPKIKVTSIHPGVVHTNLTAPIISSSLIIGMITRLVMSLIAVDSAKGALNQLWAMTDPKAESGVFYHPVGVTGKGSKLSQDKDAREKLWEWTQQEIRQHLD